MLDNFLIDAEEIFRNGDFVLQMDAEDNSKEPCYQLGCFKKYENENVSMWRVSINGWQSMKDSKVSNAV